MTYLDYQATTPLAPEALAAMLPWLTTQHANPHSPHRAGRAAKAAVEVARGQVVDALLYGILIARSDVEPDLAMPWVSGTMPWDATAASGQIVFTSGATEALNWAIKGTFTKAPPGRNRVVTIATEHAAVLDSIRSLEAEGAEVVVLPVDREGIVDWRIAAETLDERTALFAGMHVNNEIGVVQHVGLTHFSERARAVGAIMICDAVQSFGKIPIPVAFCDLIAISAHKTYGPKGIGALWIRHGCEPAPLMRGGSQEAGLRSGTLSPALCAGFGAAAQSSIDRWAVDAVHVQELYQVAREKFTAAGWHANGSRSARSPYNLNVRRDGLDVNRLMSDLRDIAFSAGSACASGSGRPSHVLRALGLTDAQARSSIRLGFGRYTTEPELTDAIDRIVAAADAQRIAA